MSRIAQEGPAVWPEGVITRYLTMGGATVDIRPYGGGKSGAEATCTGCRQGTSHDGFIDECGRSYYGEPKESQREMAVGIVQRWAQAHAESCRAMPRPEGS